MTFKTVSYYAQIYMSHSRNFNRNMTVKLNVKIQDLIKKTTTKNIPSNSFLNGKLYIFALLLLHKNIRKF